VKLWVWTLLFVSVATFGAPESSLVGIDHMPFAVRDLEQATSDYRALGFSIKPGRPHTNGIRNNHVKFPDGAGIELITAPEARDDLTSHYAALLKQGEGPAYMAFHARRFSQFVATLDGAGIPHTMGVGGGLQIKEPGLGFLFFVDDNRAPNDKPEYFAHANGAAAMTGVWLAIDDPAPFVRLFTRLGATARKEKVLVPDAVEATVVNVENGRVVLLPASRQLIKGRPIVGAEFNVSKKADKRDVFVPPAQTHGIWLHFIGQ
jgi:hypothetical protein